MVIDGDDQLIRRYFREVKLQVRQAHRAGTKRSWSRGFSLFRETGRMTRKKGGENDQNWEKFENAR